MEIEGETFPEIITLTNFIKDKDVYNKMKDEINYPKIKKYIKYPRDKSILGKESMVGMSYDYGVRFLYSYLKSNKINSALFDSIGFKIEKNKQSLLNKFDKDCKVNKLNAIVDLSLKLSMNEVLYRSGKKVNYNSFDKKTISFLNEEVIALLKLTFKEIQSNKDQVFDMNPEFHHGFIIADGDIGIGNTLVDFKAVSSLMDFKSHINQLVSYCILDQLNGNNRYEYIQIYYPRFNYYPRFKLEDLFKNKDKIIDLFTNR